MPALASAGWLFLVAMALLAPALAHGTQLGPYDIAENWGLGAIHGVKAHNIVASDQIRQMAPWAQLNWVAVHNGHLPLWNPYNGIGLPQLFDFQSAGLSLPMLVAYLFPMRLAYDVVVIGKFVIAGTGVLFLCRRVLGIDWISAAFAGSVAELSGSFSGWAGWPMAGVLCWFGWVLGAALMVERGRDRFRWSVLLAISVAFTIYGGHPESFLIMGVAVIVPLAVVVGHDVRSLGLRPVAGTLGAIAGGSAAGISMAAPLLLPGAMLLRNDVNLSRTSYVALPLESSINVALSGYYGYPITNSMYFGPRNYYEMAAFVGVVVLMLSILAVTLRWRQPTVMGLVLVSIVLFALAFVSPVAHVIDEIPVIKVVYWNRSLIPLDSVLGVLAGIGLHSLRFGSESYVARRFAVIAVVGSMLIAVLAVYQTKSALSGLALTIRDHSVEWALVQALIALGASAVLVIDRLGNDSSRHRRPRSGVFKTAAVSALGLAELVFLLAGTPNLWSSSNIGFTPTPAEKTLQQEASGQRVGFGKCGSLAEFVPIGILAESNMAYQVAEFAIYDPILPKAYVSSYESLTEKQVDARPDNFCPAITSGALARHYGVSIVLEPPGVRGPPGTLADGTIGREGVFRVPGSGIVTIEQLGTPADSATAERIPTSSTSPSEIQFVTDTTTPSTVYVHVGNYPGWSATIDDHPLKLHTWASIEMSATVPAGRHTITLSYDPMSFKIGVDLAGFAILGLAIVGSIVAVRRRKQSGRTSRSGGPTNRQGTTNSGTQHRYST